MWDPRWRSGGLHPLWPNSDRSERSLSPLGWSEFRERENLRPSRENSTPQTPEGKRVSPLTRGKAKTGAQVCLAPKPMLLTTVYLYLNVSNKLLQGGLPGVHLLEDFGEMRERDCV